MPSILEEVSKLAEPLRAKTFVKAAEFILSLSRPILVETGCFRGCCADGQSTAILALLAKEADGVFAAFELNPEHIKKATEHIHGLGLDGFVNLIQGDSITTLPTIKQEVSFAYLDSYDFEAHKAIDSQTHQLKEAEILLLKMAPVSAFLLDDCDLPHGGKAGLSAPLILANGYKEVATAYQRLFIRL